MANPSYPNDLDAFRQFLADSTDYLIAQDLNDFLTVAVKLESELGIKPSGTLGTVSARLFSTNNLTTKVPSGGWRPLKWNAIQSVNPTARFARTTQSGFQVALEPNQWAGQQTVHGEGVPAAWGSLQGPQYSTAGINWRGGQPWRIARILGENRFAVSWVAIDGQGEEITGNQPCLFGYLLWNLKT